jgi:hypothetical protein
LGNDYCGGELESNTLEGYNAANPNNPLRVVSRYSGGELHGTVDHHLRARPHRSVELTNGHKSWSSGVGEGGGGESEQCEHYIHGMPHMTQPGMRGCGSFCVHVLILIVITVDVGGVIV